MMNPGTHTTGRTGQPPRLVAPGYRWPIAAEALAALVDLGMSDMAIGRYFAVPDEAVRALRERYLHPASNAPEE